MSTPAKGSELAGQVAVVTGGGRGLGAAVVRSLAAHGAQVLINDLHPDVEQLAGELGANAVADRTDVATFAGGRQIVEAAVRAFGRVDIAVLCAGNSVQTPITEITQEQWQSSLDVHVKGHVACASAAARQMVSQGGPGRIVTFASRGAFLASGPAYAAAKAAIMGLTSAMATTLEPHAIMVNCVCPSASTQLFPSTEPRVLGGMPATHDMSPARIAPLVTYLASAAAQDITGRFFYVSGGDLAMYNRPLLMEAANIVIRNPALDWTVDQLDAAIQPLLRVGRS